MKFSINKLDVIKIMGEYTNILKENPVKPVLAGLLISVSNNRVIFKGSNTEIELIKYANCESEIDGTVLIKPSLLLEYIKLIEEDIINFEKKNGYLVVNNAEFSILDEVLYPELMELSTIIIAKEKGDKIAKLLDKVKFLSSAVNNDPVFNSVKILFSNGNLELVSTDSYRLIYLKETLNNILDKDILVPLETINIISKILKDSENEISISVSDDKLILTWENSYFSCKLLSLNFPDYKALLNNFKYDKEIEFNREELNSALKRVISVTRESVDSKNVATFDFKSSFLHISAYSSTAKISQKVNVIKNGEDMIVGLNCKYVKEYVDNIKENVMMYATSGTSMIKIVEVGNENYMYLIMPVNIRA